AAGGPATVLRSSWKKGSPPAPTTRDSKRRTFATSSSSRRSRALRTLGRDYQRWSWYRRWRRQTCCRSWCCSPLHRS
ncbi:unnamed protein product, partial [Pylaiella littoralis]